MPAVSAIALQKICIEPRWGKVTFIHVYPVVALDPTLQNFKLLSVRKRTNLSTTGSTHYLFTFWKGLWILTFDLLLPGRFCNLPISFGVAVNGLRKFRKELLRPLMGKVFCMSKCKLPPLLRVVDQGTRPEVVL